MVEEYLSWFDLTKAAVPSLYYLLAWFGGIVLLTLLFSSPLFAVDKFKGNWRLQAGSAAWLLLCTILFCPPMAFVLFLWRGRASLKLKWGEALALAVYMSLACLLLVVVEIFVLQPLLTF